MATCPICKKTSAPRAASGPRAASDGAGQQGNPSFPFCSPRCKAIDLGKWLSEEYRVPAEELTDVEGEGDVPVVSNGASSHVLN